MKQNLTLLPTRRVVLGTSLAAGAAVTLVACGSGKSADPIPSPTGTAYEATELSQLPVQGTTSVTVEGHNYLLYRPDETTVLAYTSVCTHQGCKVGTGDSTNFICPCHGSEFAKADGSVAQGPAEKALTRYATSIEGDKVKIYL
ncbi:Rieske (2Fe-2S) protein [Paeniglutamicibacter kerguelensis]|uniref:Cytochrome bc1 complex Rieske iron-sulfur subunit n=1 Tax=Paeniglutamicibacter kerguelensis TaxID=254788 RepID=A0ABS4XDM0_9MICC|nr:Rieske (2Fe-2S) protein [Paeniglutamicibacter kerguelensis]MBP2386560.1 Rieske Fe-S protein [Paeniglutamicibacter kerguelensis]